MGNVCLYNLDLASTGPGAFKFSTSSHDLKSHLFDTNPLSSHD